MCKEAAAVSQLQALGWVWVDDARWREPEVRKYMTSEEVYEAYFRGKEPALKELIDSNVNIIFDLGSGAISKKEATTARNEAMRVFAEKQGGLHDGKGWYKVEAKNGTA